MATSSLRIKRRPKGRAAKKASLNSLTAASAPVLDVAAEFKGSMGRGGDNWQDIAWEMYDRVGELRYWAGWRAGSCSRVKLIASAVDALTGEPLGNLSTVDNENEALRVQEIVNGVADGRQGQSQMIRRAVEALSIVGETWIAMLDLGEQDMDGNTIMSWFVLAADEVKSSSNGLVEIELPTGEKHEFKDSTDSMLHIWIPSPRRASEPDSPVRANLDPLQEIVRTTKTIANASKSRLIGNGILFLPAEMSLPATQGPISDRSGTEDDDTDEILAISGTPAVKQLQELLWQVATTAYDDEDSMAALIPMMATVPQEMINKVQHLKFDNQVTAVAIQTRNDAIARLAMGLDVAPERLLGLGSSTNHWTAWQISDEDVNLHISPVMELICQALTKYVLRPLLEEEGIDWRRYVVTFDASMLTVDPDKTNAATGAFTGGAITAEAYRDYLGLDAGSGYDFDALEGWQQWARDIVGRQPQFAPIFSKLLGPKGGDLPLVLVEHSLPIAPGTPTKGEITQPQQQKAPPQNAAKQPATEQKSQSRAANRAGVASRTASGVPLAVELTLVERMLMNRALELAGKRMRKRSDYDRLRDVPIEMTHRFMPTIDGADVPRLIAGWDSVLADEAIQLMPIDTEELRARVLAQIRRELTASVIDAEFEEA